VRGEGLLLGLLAVCPNGELVDALRAEKLLAVAAGDNVVRMLPPLIIDEPEIAEAIHRIDAAAARIELGQCERAAMYALSRMTSGGSPFALMPAARSASSSSVIIGNRLAIGWTGRVIVASRASETTGHLRSFGAAFPSRHKRRCRRQC
jgi:hypothetical protein